MIQGWALPRLRHFVLPSASSRSPFERSNRSQRWSDRSTNGPLGPDALETINLPAPGWSREVALAGCLGSGGVTVMSAFRDDLLWLWSTQHHPEGKA